MTLTFEEIITIPCSILKTKSVSEIDDIVSVVMEHYYKMGFPYYPIDIEKIKKEYEYLLNFNVSDLELPDNHLQQNMAGLNTVNSFHPEMWSTRCKNAKTPMEIFMDKELFRTALTKRIKYSDTKLAPFNIRKSLKAFGVQAVSNFRPTVAKWVYQNYAPKDGIVLDPCMGYGGRLFGAFGSHIKEYIGTDPNRECFNGNKKLYDELVYTAYSKRFPRMELYNMPFEDIVFENKFDLVFTSPPYFNTEKYSDQNKTQSYIRYPEYDFWRDNFLEKLIKKSYDYLKSGGYLVLNVGKPIIEDTLEIGQKVFGVTPETYWMRLSKIMGQGNKSDVSHKVEPIFIWKKI